MPSTNDAMLALISQGLEKLTATLKDDPSWVDRVDTSNEECTLLMVAVEHNEVDFVKVILSYEQDIEATNQYGMTALHFAARMGNLCLCELLISYGASFRKSLAGSPLQIAVKAGQLEVVKYFISKNLVHNVHSENLIREAIVNSQLPVLEYLLDTGWDSNNQHESMYPIHIAAAKGSIEFGECLVNHGALLDVLDIMGNTPLIIATRGGHYKLVELFLDHGANINIVDNSYSQLKAIHYACQIEKPDCLHLLLKYGANSNVLDSHGYSPLMRAISTSNRETVTVLIRENADVNFHGNVAHVNSFHPQVTPLELAIKTNCLSISILMIRCGANTRSLLRAKSLLNANIYKHKTVIDELINQKMSTPSSLEENVRLSIRKSIGSPVCEKISSLSIPFRLKQFLQFSSECKQFAESTEPILPKGALAPYMPAQWISESARQY